ncbi:unnamed protein product [Rhodiola kirilowii]
MSNKELRVAPLRQYQRRKVTVNVELGIGLPGQNGAQVGGSSDVGAQAAQPIQQQNAPVPIDVDAFDDEVLITSARAFAEARNTSRRSRVTRVVVDVDSEEQTTRFANCYKRRRNSSNCRPITVDQVYINLETSCNSKKDKCDEQPKSVPPPPPPPPPPEPAFSCPICMGELVEEMTTKCGHIFCKKCIQVAVSVKSICPTCRKKVNKKDIRRIYLPTTR